MGFPSPPLENSDLSLCPSDILLFLQQPLQTQRGGEKKKSHSLLSASSGSCFPWKKCDPLIFQWVMVLVWVSWGKNAFICLGFPIRQPFYCSSPSCMFFALSDTPAKGPVPLPKAALCPGHKEAGQPWDAKPMFFTGVICSPAN